MMNLNLCDNYSSDSLVDDYVATNIKIKVLFLKLITAKEFLNENRIDIIK
jgi:hypothetical protein